MKHAGFHLAIVAAILITYWPVSRNDFINWDDQDTIAQNADMTPPTFSAALRYWHHPAGDLYIPITYTAWEGVSSIAWDGKTLSPAPFHWASILCHALAAIVVFHLLRLLLAAEDVTHIHDHESSFPSPLVLRGRVGVGALAGTDQCALRPTADWPCLAGALLFALHPLQVEPVAWASGLKDVLCGLLSLTAIWQFLLAAKTSRRIPYILSLIAFIAAMLAKPAAVTAPILAACLDQLFLRRPWRKTALELLPAFLCAIGGMIIAKIVQPADLLPYITPLDRLRVAADAITFYLYKLIFPLYLTVDYGRPPDWVAAHPITWLTASVAIFLGLIVWRFRKTPIIPATACALVIPLLPVLGFVPFEYQYYSTVGDHYMYVALLAPALLFAYALKRRPWRFFPTAILMACAILSFHQAYYWRNTITLFEHNLRVNPTSFAAHRNLAYLDMRRGLITRAVDEFQQALTIRPDDAITHNDLGDCYYRMGDTITAIKHFWIALRQMPDDPSIHLNLGRALQKVGWAEAAKRQFDEAAILSLPPEDRPPGFH